jgi:hypothetical protein
MCFLMLMMLLWLAAFSQLGSYLRLEKAVQTRQARDQGATCVMSWGLTLLQTGLPPANPYSCRVALSGGQMFVITYASAETLKYSVSVRLATSNDTLLPVAPDHF